MVLVELGLRDRDSDEIPIPTFEFFYNYRYAHFFYYLSAPLRYKYQYLFFPLDLKIRNFSSFTADVYEEQHVVSHHMKIGKNKISRMVFVLRLCK